MLHEGLYALGTQGVRGSGASNAPRRTGRTLHTHRLGGSCNAPSTKTRIETRRQSTTRPPMPGLAMPLPLKQGLKHNERFAVPHGIYLAMPLPLKQGLKPRWQTRPGPSTRPLAMPLPIKQGLKLARRGPRSRRGLHPCNAPSNKTRIETIKRCNFLQVCPRNAPSNKTRIETRINLEDMPFDHLQCPFH